jgi:hypothetical protein
MKTMAFHGFARHGSRTGLRESWLSNALSVIPSAARNLIHEAAMPRSFRSAQVVFPAPNWFQADASCHTVQPLAVALQYLVGSTRVSDTTFTYEELRSGNNDIMGNYLWAASVIVDGR